MPQHNRLLSELLAIALLFTCASLKVSAQTYTDLHDFDCSVEGCSPWFPSVLAQGRDSNLYGVTRWGGTYNLGTVFKITPAGTLSTLYNFDSTTGASPVGGLTLASDGNFYGATPAGGAFGSGTIFRITPSGTLTVLYNFSSTNQDHPSAPPIQASDGNLYGMTILGIPYRITRSGKFKAFRAYVGLGTTAPLIQAADGYLYGTAFGGIYPFGSIFRMTLKGALQTIFVFDFTNTGGYPYGGIIQTADGNFYGTADAGAPKHEGAVFGVTLAGVMNYELVLDYSNTGGEPSAGLVAASDGLLYGAASVGGTHTYGTLFNLAPSGGFSVLYNFSDPVGSYPYSQPLQHTNGIIYGTTYYGGAHEYFGGVFYSLNAGLPQFVALVNN